MNDLAQKATGPVSIFEAGPLSYRPSSPQINGLMRNAPFWVSGHIRKINVAEISRKIVRLEFEA